MQKIKFIIGLFASLIISLFAARPVYAEVLSIQKLPSYINSNNFKLSCTSSGGDVQFSVSKNGGGYVNFGSVINTSVDPCIVQVDLSVINDQTSYTFSVGGKTTTTFYDISGPSPISGFSKERINDGKSKLSWVNPGDSDFDKVVIYRGDALGFSADGSHEIARVSGGPNSAMTYEDNYTPDSSKTYYYLIRALDHVGNSSSLAGDGGSSSTQVIEDSIAPTSEKVSILPKEAGSVLGTEATLEATPEESPSPESVPVKVGAVKWVLTHKKISLGVVLILLAIAFGLNSLRRKNN